MSRKQGNYKVGDYDLIDKFPGYRAREDITKIDPAFLVTPSQNVVLNTAGRVALIKGYELDGTGSDVIDSGIRSSFDFKTFKSDIRNMRAGFMTDALNDGKLQYRYKDANDTINWVDLMTGLTSIDLSFCEFWDVSALVKQMLWVDGSGNVYSWNGSVTTFASATVNTLTKEGTKTWAQEGFSATGSIVINGVPATYSGGYDTTTLTGVSVDFSAGVAGSIIHQLPVTTAVSAMTAILTTFKPTVIGCGRRNQVYLGNNESNSQYISKVNSFTDYTFTSPVRVVGEGALIQLDAPPIAYVAQEVKDTDKAYDLYISEANGTWGVIRATISSDNTKEILEHIRLKTAELQSAVSEKMVTKMKNQIIFIGQDKVANFLGYTSYQYVPVMTDFSWPIIDDMNSYDFTDGSIFYHKNFVYVSVPKHGLIRIYNMTDQSKINTQYSVESIDNQPWYWEAPITYPLSGFYTVDGELYGHSYTTSESYKLFTGGSFNGQDINANATFAYNGKEDRSQTKASDEIWAEGFIKQNTIIDTVVRGDIDTFEYEQTVQIDGSDDTYVAFGALSNSLGQNSLGVVPNGGEISTAIELPAWFHVAKTYPQVPYYLEQISFSTSGVDLQWELTCFGTNSKLTAEGNNDVTS
jgi:hypothetical protein